MMTKKQWSARTRTDLILEVWEALDCESVGAKELTEIQEAIGKKFGSGAIESPASIARTLADEGAVLRHPEILEADTSWRQTDGVLSQSDETSIHDLETAERFIQRLDLLARGFQANNDRRGLASTRAAAVAAKQQALSLVKSHRFDPKQRAEQREIASWLTTWLESPQIFNDWLDLRKRSAEFRKRFAPKDV